MTQPAAEIATPHITEPKQFLDVRSLARNIVRRQSWFVLFIIFDVLIVYSIFTDAILTDAWNFITPGIAITAQITLFSFLFAVIIGLIVAFGRISKNIFIYNIATFYVEIFRGLPLLVIILIFAFVVTPGITTAIAGADDAPRDNCLVDNPVQPAVPFLDDFLQRAVGIPEERVSCTFIRLRDIDSTVRIIFAFAVTYGAFMCEVFRAGIESIGRGQMEAARSLGMTYAQAMRHIILPQAIRNTLPALANNFILLLKDTSLASTVAVSEISKLTTQYASNNFRYPQALLVLSFTYANLTIILSMFVYLLEARLTRDRHEE